MSKIRLFFTLAAFVTLAVRPLAQSTIKRQPIIDVHLHT